MVGHVDHGKTSLTRALTGKWTDTHSEELKRGITIKIGYADFSVFKDSDGVLYPEAQVPKGNDAKFLRRISLLDAPGHETLMTTTIAASSILDGAILVIAANEPCPQPQTLEHLMVLDILGIKNVVVVQNKIDLVTQEKAMENYHQIKKFLEGSTAHHAPIIPISANYSTNLDALMSAIDEHIPTPKRDTAAPARMYVARSFDVNKPGTKIEKLLGGVVGGSLISGVLKTGDEIELRPGIPKRTKDKELLLPMVLTVSKLMCGSEELKEAKPGGLISISTTLDPSLSKSDHLVGNLVGKPGSLPPVLSEIELEYTLLKREGFDNPPLRLAEPIVISIGTSTGIGVIAKLKSGRMELKLKRGICAEPKAKVAVSRRIGQRWRLAGWGLVR
jgi:translation initiation factor 2 subunit 3